MVIAVAMVSHPEEHSRDPDHKNGISILSGVMNRKGKLGKIVRKVNK